MRFFKPRFWRAPLRGVLRAAPNLRPRLRKASGIVALHMLAVLLLPATAVAGTIDYDAGERRVWVAGFPEERPATLCAILAADREAGWGVIVYDSTTETFTLQASLWIGTDKDFGTFFQIGRPDFPRETLVLHGDLQINPPRVSGQRYDRRYLVSNRFTFGYPDRPDIRPVVKIACSKRNEFAVRVLPGPVPDDNLNRPIGEWFMFHGTLTAATPDPEHTYGASIALSHAGLNYHMHDSVFSWWRGGLFPMVVTVVRSVRSWAPLEQRMLRNMVFEDGAAVGGGSIPMSVGGVYRRLEIAHAGEPMAATFVRCRFENNREHVRLPLSHAGVVFTDCVFDEPAMPLRVPRSTRDEGALRRYSVYKESSDLSLVTNPGIIERMSLRARVVDEGGRPVRRAAVFIHSPGDADRLAVHHGMAVTDSEGLTPDDPEAGALVINRRELRPAEDPAEPEIVTHAFVLRVEAPGFAPREITLDGVGDIPRPLEIALMAE